MAMAIELTALRFLWIGLAGHWWSAAQLERIEAALRRPHRLDRLWLAYEFEFAAGLRVDQSFARGERVVWGIDASVREAVDSTSWWQRELLRFAVGGTLWRYPVLVAQLKALAVQPGFKKELLLAWREENSGKEAPGRFVTVSESKELIKDADRIVSRALRVESFSRILSVGCALERHRLAHGTYPEELPPTDPPALRLDPMNGVEPLNYVRSEDGQRATVYSVGWDEIDDEGVNGRTHTDGDWSWHFGPAGSEVEPAEKEEGKDGK